MMPALLESLSTVFKEDHFERTSNGARDFAVLADLARQPALTHMARNAQSRVFGCFTNITRPQRRE